MLGKVIRAPKSTNCTETPLVSMIGGYFCESLFDFLSTAESLPEASDEAGDDATLKRGPTAGSV